MDNWRRFRATVGSGSGSKDTPLPTNGSASEDSSDEKGKERAALDETLWGLENVRNNDLPEQLVLVLFR